MPILLLLSSGYSLTNSLLSPYCYCNMRDRGHQEKNELIGKIKVENQSIMKTSLRIMYLPNEEKIRMTFKGNN